MSIELAVFKAITVTKEFSKCHSRWQLCPFPRIAFYWLLQARTVTKDFSKCHAVADGATSWNSIYYKIDLI